MVCIEKENRSIIAWLHRPNPSSKEEYLARHEIVVASYLILAGNCVNMNIQDQE